MARLPLNNVICRAFFIAFLVSGDIEVAEESVLEAIRSLDPDDLSTDAFFVCVSTLSIQRSNHLPEKETDRECNDMAGRLPPEMQNLLKLSRTLRQCFVVRILLGLPQGICASLLKLPEYQIADLTCHAIFKLSDALLDGKRRSYAPTLDRLGLHCD